MQTKLALFNAALILYVCGLLAAIGISYGTGAILVLMSASIIISLWVSQLSNAFRNRNFKSIEVIGSTVGVLLLAELFIQGYSISIGHSLLSIPSFFQAHTLTGLLFLGIFVWLSVHHINKVEAERNRYILLTIVTLSSLISLIGYLGFAGIVQGTVKLIYYGYVFLTFAYLVYFITSPERKTDPKQFKTAVGIAFLMLFFWVLRWQFISEIPAGIWRVVLQLGFVVLIVIPLAILFLRKNYFIFPFLFYSVISELLFVGFSADFKYITDVGVNECVGYESAVQYPLNRDPGVPISELLRAPEENEIVAIREEWKNKTFRSTNVRTEYSRREENGDSLKVISHDVNGLKHYGLMRIPAGLDTRLAPILLVLHGGGSNVDVLGTDYLQRIVSGSCRGVLNNYIVVAPSFRGDIVRGEGFCFRSEGYTGDVWSGAAEDAASLLEVVKDLYGKEPERRTVAIGISRGATVALILSALTEKITHAIAISTHADFLNEDVLQREKVGADYARVFFTPRETPENIRKKILTSSPLYFAEHIRSFEIHQGTTDDLTTVRHAKAIQTRLKELHRDTTGQVHIYEGHGHGYDDENIVCASLTRHSK
jgi:predicted esterase